MAEQYPSPEKSDPTMSNSQKKKIELELIIPFLKESSRVYSFSFTRNPWENGFFIKLIGGYSRLSEQVLKYWNESLIFEPISPVWKVNLSTNAFHYLIAEPEKEYFMYYLIDLMKGRFTIKEKFDYYFLLTPQDSDGGDLFAMLVENLTEKPGLQILVGKLNENPSQVLEEICGKPSTMEKLSELAIEKILIIKQNEYFPGDQYFKNKTEERIYINPKLPFTSSPEFKSKLPNNLATIKSHVEKNHKAYLSFFGATQNDFSNWTNLVFHFMFKQMSSQFLFSILPNFSTSWDVSIEMELLQVLKNIKEKEFLHYLNKITKFTQCLAIEDFGLFYKLNESSDDDFLVLPLVLENTNLKTIFSVLCVGKSQLTGKFEYQLRLVDFLNLNHYQNQIQEFRNSKKYLQINEICESPGIKSLVIIEKNQKLLPICQLNDVEPPAKYKKIHFLYIFPKKAKNYNFTLSSEQGGANKSEKIIELFDDNDQLATQIVEINTKFSVNMNYTLNLAIIGWWDSVHVDKTNRVIQNLKYQFLFDVDFFRDNKDKSKSTASFKDFYYQLHIYLTHYLQLKDFKSIEYLVHSFSIQNQKLLELPEHSVMKQLAIVEFIDLQFLSEIDQEDIEMLYRLLSILGLINIFPSKKVTINNSNLANVLSMIEKHQNKYLQVFKVKLNYKLAINGLAKVLAYERMRENNSVKFYIDTIIDYETLYDVIVTYIEILKKNQVFINSEEMNNIIEYTNHFTGQKKIYVSEKILGLLNQLEQIINILLNQVLDHKSIEDKKRFFLNALNSCSLDNEGLLHFLRFLSSNNIYEKRLFANEDILNFINLHLNHREKVNLCDFHVIKNILEVIKNESHIQGFNTGDFLKDQVLTYGFHECIDLLLVTPTFIPGIFDKWIKKKMLKNMLKEDIISVEKELQGLPETLRSPTASCVINRFHKYYALSSTESISHESTILLEAYKQLLSKP